MGYLKTCNFWLFHFKTDFTDILHYDNTSFKFDIWHCVIKVKVTPSVCFLHCLIKLLGHITSAPEVEIKQLCSSDMLYTFFSRLV